MCRLGATARVNSTGDLGIRARCLGRSPQFIYDGRKAKSTFRTSGADAEVPAVRWDFEAEFASLACRMPDGG